MVNSMTGFATCSGSDKGTGWVWEMRGVNGKGLDIRVRLPEGREALEKKVKNHVSDQCQRGTITVGLRIALDQQDGVPELRKEALDALLTVAADAAELAQARGLTPAPVDIVHLLNTRGVLSLSSAQEDASWWEGAAAQLPQLVSQFSAARADEGRALHRILVRQLEELERLQAAAIAVLNDRKAELTASVQAKLADVLGDPDRVDHDRLEQELALLIVKSDVTEELDRLAAHIEAAHALLKADGPVGRKFDFLMQEFNREANTLCAKSGHSELTRIGLDLKTVIDQMREQVQNVE